MLYSMRDEAMLPSKAQIHKACLSACIHKHYTRLVRYLSLELHGVLARKRQGSNRLSGLNGLGSLNRLICHARLPRSPD